MTDVPPGWYADPAAPPSGPVWWRWWDGTRWTDHVAPGHQGPVERGPTTADGVPLAGWWWRVLAYLVDVLVLAIPNVVLTLPAQLDLQRQMQELTRELEDDSAAGTPPDLGAFFADYVEVLRDNAVVMFLPAAVLATAYFAGMWRWRGATVGQLVTGLRVRPVARPGRPTWVMAIVRVAVLALLPSAIMVLSLLSGSGTVLLVGYVVALLLQLLNVVWPLWDDRRQALHDKAAGTVVVRPGR